VEWCKLYASLQHDKDLRRAGEAATVLFVYGMCYLTAEETDGYIADDVMPDFKLARVTQRAAALVRHGLWDRIEDGYVVPGWKEKQKDLLTQLERRKRDAERKRRKRKEAGVRGMSADASAECPTPEKRRQEDPPDPPETGGDPGRRCKIHKRQRRGCADCALPALAPVPDWCGACSPARRVEDPDTGADLGACPRCHPSKVRAS